MNPSPSKAHFDDVHALALDLSSVRVKLYMFTCGISLAKVPRKRACGYPSGVDSRPPLFFPQTVEEEDAPPHLRPEVLGSPIREGKRQPPSMSATQNTYPPPPAVSSTRLHSFIIDLGVVRCARESLQMDKSVHEVRLHIPLVQSTFRFPF